MQLTALIASRDPRSLRKLQQLNLGFTTIITGHWSPVHGPELVDRFLQMLEQRRG